MIKELLESKQPIPIRSFLLEGTGISAARERYAKMNDGREMPKDLEDLLLQIDPTETKKYVDWLVKVERDLKPDMVEHYKEVLTTFEDLVKKNKIEGRQKDIYSFKTLEEVFDLVERLKFQKTKGEEEKEAEEAILSDSTNVKKTFENDKVEMWQVKNVQGSCELGKGLPWCISQQDKDVSGHYFKSYSRSLYSFFYISRKKGVRKDDNLNRVMLQIGKGYKEWILNTSLNEQITNEKTIQNYLDSLGIPINIKGLRAKEKVSKVGRV